MIRALETDEYRGTFRRGKRLKSQYFTFIYRKEQTGLGTALAKKSIKRAVDRNSLKRRIKETYRLNIDTLKGYQIVVIAHKDSLSLSKKEINEELKRLWVQLND